MKRWTDEEIDTLKDNYQNESRKNLCLCFPDRNWRAIKAKARKINLFFHGTAEQRFWKYVEKKLDNECWCWTGAISQGYGSFGTDSKIINAHRFSWRLYFGKIPKGLFVCHICDNRKCVNPSHLFVGTHRDNDNDRDNKNRQAKGEKNGMAKLTLSQVKQIRTLKDKFLQREIAIMFDVSRELIGRIHRNEIWKS